MIANQNLQMKQISNDFNAFWDILIKPRNSDEVINIKSKYFLVVFKEQDTFDNYIKYIEKWFEIWLYSYLSKIVSDSEFETQKTYYFEKFGSDFFESMVNVLTHNFSESSEKDPNFFTRLEELVFCLSVVVQRVQVSTGFLDMHSKVAEMKDDVATKTNKLTAEINKIKTELNETQSLSNSLKEQVKQTEETLSDSNKKNAEFSITILGIFVAIIMVFFGDITIISKVAQADIPILLLLTCVLYDSIILLFFLIGRFNGRSLQCKCLLNAHCSDCLLCEKRKNLREICLLRNKYPYIYWANLFFVFCFIFLQCKQFFIEMQYDKINQVLYSIGIACLFVIVMFVLELIFVGILRICTSVEVHIQPKKQNNENNVEKK